MSAPRADARPAGGWGVTDLACRRGARTVLRGVSFQVPPGTALLLTGPNGSGKTTLLRTLAGLSPPAAGRIDAPADAFAHAGHADALKAQLTVAENLAFWSAAHGSGGAAVADAVEGFDLSSLLRRRAGELSAGQRRRAGLARMALTGRPIWVLDEPTASLDAGRAAHLTARIAAHLAGGGSAAIATHLPLDLPDARTLDVAAFAAAATQAPSGDPFLEAVE